jgi:hypothetical protein
MGLIFLVPALLRGFLSWAESTENMFFGMNTTLAMPADPLHLLLIHGFGAGAVILGATLLYAARHPAPLVSFILFDGLGRLLYALVMFYYTYTFALPRLIFAFAMLEFIFGVIYIWGSRMWRMDSRG